MIFMAKVCPKAINFAIAESIHQLLVLRPHPSAHAFVTYDVPGGALGLSNVRTITVSVVKQSGSRSFLPFATRYLG